MKRQEIHIREFYFGTIVDKSLLSFLIVSHLSENISCVVSVLSIKGDASSLFVEGIVTVADCGNHHQSLFTLLNIGIDASLEKDK